LPAGRRDQAASLGLQLCSRDPKLGKAVYTLELERRFRVEKMHTLTDARRHPRFKIEVGIEVFPRNLPVVRGHTADISESGVSAILQAEVPIGEVVRLEFDLPLGSVEVAAMVRQRSAFRYGFQFLEASTAQETIGRTCRQLAMQQALPEPS
jgi:hypothetical protein